MAYLEDPNFLKSTTGKKLNYANRNDIARKGERLSVRLFPNPVVPNETEDDPDEPELQVVE